MQTGGSISLTWPGIYRDPSKNERLACGPGSRRISCFGQKAWFFAPYAEGDNRKAPFSASLLLKSVHGGEGTPQPLPSSLPRNLQKTIGRTPPPVYGPFREEGDAKPGPVRDTGCWIQRALTGREVRPRANLSLCVQFCVGRMPFSKKRITPRLRPRPLPRRTRR